MLLQNPPRAGIGLDALFGHRYTPRLISLGRSSFFEVAARTRPFGTLARAKYSVRCDAGLRPAFFEFHHVRTNRPRPVRERSIPALVSRQRPRPLDAHGVIAKRAKSRLMLRGGGMLAALVAVVLTAGCVQRRLTIRSNPPGAYVYVDNYPIGTTPVSTDFVYYGKRQIRLVRDGYETLTVDQKILPPWYEWFGIDFISENLVPANIRDEQTLNFTMVPQQVPSSPQLTARAEELRASSQAQALRAAAGAIASALRRAATTARHHRATTAAGRVAAAIDAAAVHHAQPRDRSVGPAPPSGTWQAPAPATLPPPGPFPPPNSFAPPPGELSSADAAERDTDSPHSMKRRTKSRRRLVRHRRGTRPASSWSRAVLVAAWPTVKRVPAWRPYWD